MPNNDESTPATVGPEPVITAASDSNTVPVVGAWRERYRTQAAARRRLAERYGSVLEQRWTADPNAPRVDAVSLLWAFLNKAGPDSIQPTEMQQAPALEPDDARAALHMIRAARDDAHHRDTAVIQQALAHGVTWDELAHTLDTTIDELHVWLRRYGDQPETWGQPDTSSTSAAQNTPDPLATPAVHTQLPASVTTPADAGTGQKETQP